MLFIAAALCGVMGVIIVVSGEERRIRILFGLVGAGCALLCVGLWAASSLSPLWTILASRVVMTLTVAIVTFGLFAIVRICRAHVPLWIGWILVVNYGLIFTTVWITDIYFTGKVHRYPWGLYAAGKPLFAVIPILTALPMAYGLRLLFRNYRTAHPLDRDRALYLFVSLSILSLSLLDYLPHFGVAPFGGLISPIVIPLFAGIFGYACLRFHLLAFREWVARMTGWLATMAVIVALYVLVVEINSRLRIAPPPTVYAVAMGICLAALLAFGRRLSLMLERLISGIETDFQEVMNQLSEELLSLFNEETLTARLERIGAEVFGASEIGVIQTGELSCEPTLHRTARTLRVIETEPYRRAGNSLPVAFGRFEYLIPLGTQDELLGAIALGPHRRHTLYSSRAIRSFRVLGNIFSIALANSRHVREVKERRRKAERALEDFLRVLASAIESKDKYTGGHVERVANYSRDLAAKCGISGEALRAIYLGAMVHDVGKIGVRDAVLNKPGVLTPEEMAQMRTHPVLGERLLSMIEDVPVPVVIASAHQERFDWTGYPNGWKGDRIPLEARIVTLADYWDAITTDRPYRNAMPLEEAVALMHRERGRAFDPHLFDLFMDPSERIFLRHLNGARASKPVSASDSY
jgi:hypothetical protein